MDNQDLCWNVHIVLLLYIDNIIPLIIMVTKGNLICFKQMQRVYKPWKELIDLQILTTPKQNATEDIMGRSSQ